MVIPTSHRDSNLNPDPWAELAPGQRHGEGEDTGRGVGQGVAAQRDTTIRRLPRGKRYKPKGNCLKVRCHFEDELGEVREIVALVDTGADINLVRSALLPREVTRTVYPPLSFTRRIEAACREGIGRHLVLCIFREWTENPTLNKS